MAELHVVAGLPGSGKTHLVRRLAEPVGGLVIDDYFKDSIGDRPETPYSRHYPELIQSLRAGRVCFVADRAFCYQPRREEFIGIIRILIPQVRVEWLFFANDPAACRRNVVNRSAKEMPAELAWIDESIARYHIPAGANEVPVYNADGAEGR